MLNMRRTTASILLKYIYYAYSVWDLYHWYCKTNDIFLHLLSYIGTLGISGWLWWLTKQANIIVTYLFLCARHTPNYPHSLRRQMIHTVLCYFWFVHGSSSDQGISASLVACKIICNTWIILKIIQK
jgi:hypothetical protein